MSNLVKLGNKDIEESALDNLIKLANCLDDVKTRNNGDIYVKFKKDVIIETDSNFAILSGGFNVQHANQIHFNPEFEPEEFRKMIRESFSDSRFKIIERAAELMDKELTKDEIIAVVNGKKIMEVTDHDHSCDHEH